MQSESESDDYDHDYETNSTSDSEPPPLNWEGICVLGVSAGPDEIMLSYKQIDRFLQSAFARYALRRLRCTDRSCKLYGGSVLDAVMFTHIKVFIESGGLGRGYAMEFLSENDLNPFAGEEASLLLVRDLVAIGMDIILYSGLQWADRRINLSACIKLALAAGLFPCLTKLQLPNSKSFFHYKVVKIAMIDGWPMGFINILRRHGAVCRLAIVEACAALRGLQNGTVNGNAWESPLNDRNAWDFPTRDSPSWDEWSWEIEEPVKCPEARLANALAWYNSENLYAGRIRKVVASALHLWPDHDNVKDIDAFLFGPRLSNLWL